MGRAAPAIHGDDHLPWGPDPIRGLSLWATDDGSTRVVDPVLSLFIPKGGGRLTDNGAGQALFRPGRLTSFTPVLSSSVVVDPSNYSASAFYWHCEDFVAFWGKVEMGPSFNPGSGAGVWQVQLPLAANYLATALIGTAHLLNASTKAKLQLTCSSDSPGTYMNFFGQDAWPVGQEIELNNTGLGGLWTFSDDDMLVWSVVYVTTDIDSP